MANAVVSAQTAHRLNAAARLAGVSVGKLRKDIRDGLLEARKLGRCTVILSDELQRYLDAGKSVLSAPVARWKKSPR